MDRHVPGRKDWTVVFQVVKGWIIILPSRKGAGLPYFQVEKVFQNSMYDGAVILPVPGINGWTVMFQVEKAGLLCSR
jgi:hypothetical protein